MYPVFRFAKEAMRIRHLKGLKPGEVHESWHICWPWDVDPWMELNNGRTLTLFDLGRVPLMIRCGVIPEMRRQGWGIAVAGASVRYRRRVRMFHRVRMTSTLVGWGERFFYVEQTMWRGGEAVSNGIFRLAMTDADGIAAPSRMARKLGWPETSPKLPAHVTAWMEAEKSRPWPPER